MKSSRFSFFVFRFLPILALVGTILLFFHKMAFTNLILARGDTFLYFYPYWQAAADALRSGRIPLWNPNLFMGAPFLANSQVGFFYPLNWPLWRLLPPPYAVSASILLHLAIAATGTYLAGRRVLGLSREAAWLAAALFALGGYVTAQVEHVNQLQGMAWLPWFLLVLGAREWNTGRGKRMAGVGVLFALQLLAGHTQTAFITGVGVGVFLIVNCELSIVNCKLGRCVWALLAGGALALGLTAVQLLPTWELTQVSSRQGGLALNEVVSFSLHPLLLGRALLPGVGQSLFSEYVAFVPLTAVLLAFIGAGQWRRNRMVRPLLGVTAVGLLLALGRFTPVYWLLAHLPGFDLFRVPARWLVWYALGMALLAGVGLDGVRQRQLKLRLHLPSRPAPTDRSRRRLVWQRLPRIYSPGWFWGSALFLLFLMGWSVVSVPLSRFLPVAPESPAAYPSAATAVAWIVELILALAILRSPLSAPRSPLILLSLISLFLASRPLPYNQLATPEAYFDVRPSIARLQAQTNTPPDRFLSLSDIFFDPGDQAEIDTIYADVLDAAAQYDYTIAIKQKEIIAPNLSMAFGLTAVDGFDGGILPLRDYSRLMSLLLGEGKETTDGRLRENLERVPAAKWLDLFNARYLITDKVGDVWQDGVFFDLQHPVTLTRPVSVGYMPPFAANRVWLVADGAPGYVEILLEDGRRLLAEPTLMENGLIRVFIDPRPVKIQQMALHPAEGQAVMVQGVTLVNTEDDTFQPLVLGQYRLIHSGDVKIYENLDVLPRVFLLSDWSWQPDGDRVLAEMRRPNFDPRRTAVLQGQGIEPSGEPVAGSAQIMAYSPEKVVIRAETEGTAVLLLTDAFYPGWQAAIDGKLSPVYQADGLFRAIILESGEHEITFSFVSPGFGYGRAISVIAWAILAMFIGWEHRRRTHRKAEAKSH